MGFHPLNTLQLRNLYCYFYYKSYISFRFIQVWHLKKKKTPRCTFKDYIHYINRDVLCCYELKAVTMQPWQPTECFSHEDHLSAAAVNSSLIIYNMSDKTYPSSWALACLSSQWPWPCHPHLQQEVCSDGPWCLWRRWCTGSWHLTRKNRHRSVTDTVNHKSWENWTK